ncbi:hypothetical protein ACSSS7_004521 [Eimeria intestinalis]
MEKWKRQKTLSPPVSSQSSGVPPIVWVGEARLPPEGKIGGGGGPPLFQTIYSSFEEKRKKEKEISRRGRDTLDGDFSDSVFFIDAYEDTLVLASNSTVTVLLKPLHQQQRQHQEQQQHQEKQQHQELQQHEEEQKHQQQQEQQKQQVQQKQKQHQGHQQEQTTHQERQEQQQQHKLQQHQQEREQHQEQEHQQEREQHQEHEHQQQQQQREREQHHQQQQQQQDREQHQQQQQQQGREQHHQQQQQQEREQHQHQQHQQQEREREHQHQEQQQQEQQDREQWEPQQRHRYDERNCIIPKDYLSSRFLRGRVSFAFPLLFPNRSIQIRNISCGSNHVLVSTSVGGALAMGVNEEGQLGDRSFVDRKHFVSVSLDPHLKVFKVKAGKNTSYAIVMGPEDHPSTSPSMGPACCTPEKKPRFCLHAFFSSEESFGEGGNMLYAWGSNAYQELGQQEEEHQEHQEHQEQEGCPITPPLLCSCVPLRVPIPPGVDGAGSLLIDVACGSHHAIVLTNNGDAFSFGLNAHGQLGRGHLSPTKGPTPLSLPNPIKAISCGDCRCLAITKQGRKKQTEGRKGKEKEKEGGTEEERDKERQREDSRERGRKREKKGRKKSGANPDDREQEQQQKQQQQQQQKQQQQEQQQQQQEHQHQQQQEQQ